MRAGAAVDDAVEESACASDISQPQMRVMHVFGCVHQTHVGTHVRPPVYVQHARTCCHTAQHAVDAGGTECLLFSICFVCGWFRNIHYIYLLI